MPQPRALGYDARGNLASGNLNGDAVWAFGYDAENRMTSACKPAMSGACSSPAVNAAYAYDPLGRRTHKSGVGVTETFFYNDGDDEIAEYDGSKNPKVIYIPGPAIDEPVAMVTGFGSTLAHEYFHANHQGSVIAMSDDSRAMVEGPFTYDPYGNCFKNSTTCRSLAGTEPFKFTGRRLDPETGLYAYRARMFSSSIGHFLQTDPVGYTADLNLYTYGGNEPVGKTDPTGKDWADLLTDPQAPQALAETLSGIGLVIAGGSGEGGSALATVASGGAAAPATVPAAIASAGLITTGTAMTAQGASTLSNIINRNDSESEATGSQERDANRAKGIPDSKLGPSGKPKVHDVQHSTKKEAREAAQREARGAGGQARHDTTSTSGHYQAEDEKGENVKPVVHHCYPPDRC